MPTMSDTKAMDEKAEQKQKQQKQEQKQQGLPMDDQFAAVVAEAAKRYKKASGQKVEDFMTPPMRSLDDLKAQLDRQNEGFTTFRAKRDNIYSTLSAMLTPVEIVGDVIVGAASETFPPAQSIYSAVMYLIGAANNVSAAYDTILELFSQLEDFTSRMNAYLKTELSPEMREKIVRILAALFEVLVLATEEIKLGRFKSYLKQLIGSESPVKPALERLKALALAEERQAIADTYNGVAQVSAKTDRVENVVQQVNQSLQSFRSEYKERMTVEHQDRLREILEPSVFPEDYYSSFTRYRVEGTGEWLLQDEGLKSWADGETQYLWVSGAPGTGKSFLSTKLITWGKEKLPQLAYFYFRASNPETRSVLQALRDVAFQLTESDAFYGRQVGRRVHSTEDIKTIPSAYRHLFVEPFEDDERGRSLHIVLDGIDEAEPGEIEELLAQMKPQGDFVYETRSKVYIAFFGRTYLTDTVLSYLDPLSSSGCLSQIQVTHSRNAKDVQSYIESGVMNSKNLGRRDDLKHRVIKLMVERADGLFILAKFMLADVNRAKRPSTILKSLETYPQEINGMLHKTLENLAETISEEDASDLNEMLQWIAYAEQSLTLEQLEALLILRFDETPFRFEDTLRGQYACFFELEREDGLTTDDLIKDHERRRRSKSRDSTPSDRPRRSSSVTRESPTRRALSPAQKLNMATRRRTSPVNLPSSPVERAPRSPVFRALRSEAPDLDEMEFRSKKSTTTVTFFHNSVREFFRDENTDKITCGTDGIALGVKTSEAKLHILKTCLRIFNDEAWFKSKSLPHEKHHPMKQYAAWYWQEHLASLDPSKVSKEDKKTIGQHVYKMLTDERIIHEWSIMYEKNDEGIVILTDKNLKALRQWMEDADVLASLEPAAREWAQKSATKPTGIVENIGRYYAKGWLDANFDRYIPTKFCFKIVQCLAFMELGHKWSDSQEHWTDIPFAERVKTATDWAKIEVTAHSFRRVGSTYLTAGLHNDALKQYNEALKLDSNSVESLGRKAFCLFRDKRYADAMDVALECEGIEDKSITSGKLSKDELAASKWRLYRDRVIIAQSSYHIGDVGTSIAYYHKAIASAAEATLRHSERFEASIGLLEVLAEENRHADMMKLLETMSLQPTGPRHEQSQLVDLLIFLYNKPLLLESIPKAACREGKDAFLLDRLEICISVAHSVRDALKELYLRLALGSTYIYGHDTEEALKVFEQISLVEYRPRGNVATRQAHANSFQKLAGIYKQKVLHAGITSVAADEWIRKLEEIQTKQSAHENQDLPTSMLGSDVNVAAIFLARFYRLRGRKAEAERLLAALIVDSCEILEDEELKNDEYALENLLRLFTAADEVTDAKALAVSMRRLDPDASIHTPLDSPVQQRGRPIEPKLPDIQSSNRSCAQCLKNITPREEFHFCRYCLDAFCTPCLDNVIKKPDNKGKGGMGAGEGVVCRADHEWFGVPPLRRVLHTGQMLFDGGEKRGFVEWREEIKERWVKRVK